MARVGDLTVDLSAEVPSYTAVSVKVAAYAVSAPDSVPVDAVGRLRDAVVGRLRDEVAAKGLIAVSDVLVEHHPDTTGVLGRGGTIRASVRVLVDPPAEVREHLAERTLRLEPTVSELKVPIVRLGGRPTPVVDGRRPIRETRTVPHAAHERPDPNCEQCQQAIFAETARRAADYVSERALDSDEG